MTSDGHGEGLPTLPGFSALGPQLQQLLLAAEAGDATERSQLLERVADVLNVFIALDLLQYIFMPPQEAHPAVAGIDIDLTAPEQEDSAAIAWFSIDEAGVDDYRDAVTMFGDIADVLNPPIVLDTSDEDEEDALPRGD